MENFTSHAKRYIIIPNNVIRNMGKLGGVNAFRVYVEVLLNKNWRNELFITPKLLMERLGRSKKYWTEKMIPQIQTLAEKSIIAVDKDIDGLGINELLHIQVIWIAGAATEIKCANAEIFNLQASVNVNTLFAVFTFISMCIDRELKFARVPHKTIAERIGVCETTVEKAVAILEGNGFVGVSRGIFDKSKGKNVVNKYRVFDYNSILWKVKHGLASLPIKQVLTEESEASIERQIVEVISNPNRFSPCVFEGFAAKMFKEYYNTHGYGILFTITSIADMPRFVNSYEGILYVEGGIIVIFFEKLTDGIEDYIVPFIENSVLPIVLLLGDEEKIENNKLKSLLSHVFLDEKNNKKQEVIS